jgi:hypothetical protein
MDNALHKNRYFAAFAEASSELEKIAGEIEELSRRRSRIEKAVAVLKCQIDLDRPASPTVSNANPTIVWKRIIAPGLKLETRVRFSETERDFSN